MPFGIKFNARAFRKSFILNQIKGSGQIEHFVKALGPTRLAWLIQQDRDIKDMVPPETIAEYRAKGRRYNWVKDIIADDDMRGLLPQWVLDLVQEHGDHGEKWLTRQIQWIRGFLIAGEG